MKTSLFCGLTYLIFSCLFANAQEVDPYYGTPDWYKPGHPIDPAEPVSISTLPGFRIEKLLNVPRSIGSLTAMTLDSNGDLLVVTQHQPGIYRISPSAIGSGIVPVLEPLGGAARTVGWAEGLLYAFDSLYVTISESNDVRQPGLYRLLDTDDNGEYDQVKYILSLRSTGEHAAHNLVVGPDGNSLFLMCGNGTPVPEQIVKKRTLRTTGLDHLMPDGFGSSEYTDGGWILQMDPDGDNMELFASGFRNPYDLAFNKQGDLFTYDSDMEYDLGAPWYRPTRICHVVSGAEFGWRSGPGKWPDHYEDSVRPVVNIGPGSPTGITFGYTTAFPEKYKRAMYVLDWTYATVYAVHLKADGASYSAEFEVFASGLGLPLTDCVVGKDGALYFSVGGRKLGSAIYRIWYAGPEEDSEDSDWIGNASESRDLRLYLESFHGKEKEKITDAVWPYLGSEDRAIRYAARIALESQPVEQWRNRALTENQLQTKFPALLALARQGNDADLLRVLDQLAKFEFEALSEDGLLLALRIFERVLGRGGSAIREEASGFIPPLRTLLPHKSRLVNRELARVLCYLGDFEVIDSLLDLMAHDRGERNLTGADLVSRNLRYGSRVLGMMEAAPMVERMFLALMLTWLEDGWTTDQREQYFGLVVEAIETSKGGKGYSVLWKQILEAARTKLGEEEIKRLSHLWKRMDEVNPLPAAKGPGRIWELDYLLKRFESGFGSRDFENGKTMYAAASCITCHEIVGEGGIVGPNLTGIGQRFTIRDLLDSIIHPSNVISDQYRLMTVSLKNGEVFAGRIQSKDSEKTTILPNALNPTQFRSILNAQIKSVAPMPVSTMPPNLLNSLNEEEVLDLIAYLIAGGRSNHQIYR